MERYIHKVHYYETDKMGIVHHSNYVRWLEEARVYMMDKMGYSFARLEEEGILSPVLNYYVDIKHSTRFNDDVEIIPKIKLYNSVRLEIEYEIKTKGELVAKATTNHCFTNINGLPQRLNKTSPELDMKFKEQLKKGE